jgi:hypothetical protein
MVLDTALRLPQDEAVCVCVEVFFVTQMTGIPPSFSAPSKLRHEDGGVEEGGRRGGVLL